MSDPRPAPIVQPILESERLLADGLERSLESRPLVLEIGFGRAELIIDQAAADPARTYLGVEVSRKRVAKAGRRVERAGLTNVKLIHTTAEYLVERVLPPASVCECWINFSDPWPKKRHFKRRLFQPPLVARLAQVLEPGAVLHAATDHPGYAVWIDDVLRGATELLNCHSPERWSVSPPARRQTGYEAEWLALGRSIAYFEYRRK